MTKPEDHLMAWLVRRIDEAAAVRRDDYAALSHGGAGFEEGYRMGHEEALRDVLDMVAQTWRIKGDA